MKGGGLWALKHCVTCGKQFRAYWPSHARRDNPQLDCSVYCRDRARSHRRRLAITPEREAMLREWGRALAQVEAA